MKTLVLYDFESSESHVVAPNFYHASVTNVFPRMGIRGSFIPDLRQTRLYKTLLLGRLSPASASILALVWLLLTRRREYDVVLGWSTYGLVSAAVRALCRWQRPRTCVILYQLDLTRGNGLRARLRARLIRLASNGCDLLLTLDSSQAAEFGRILRRMSGTTTAIHYGIVTEWFDQQRGRVTEPPASELRPRLFCPGAAHRDDRLLREAVESLDVDVRRYRLEGPGGRTESDEQVGSTRWRSVTNAPYDEYLRECVASDLVVIPVQNHDKPVGLTALLECMALGKAVVITRGASTDDYVDDGDTALLSEPGDAMHLRRVIDAALREPGRVTRVGEAARRAARERLSVDVCGTKLGELLLRLHHADPRSQVSAVASAP